MQTKPPYLATVIGELPRALGSSFQRQTEYSLEEIVLVHPSTEKEG
jgi:hypothetical protein